MYSSNKTLNTLGVFTGILSIVFAAIIKFETKWGHSIEMELYSNDSATGVQNAAAQTATNTHYIASLLGLGFAMLLFIIGLALVCYFGGKLVESDASSYRSRSASYESSGYHTSKITETTHPTKSDGDWFCTKCRSLNPSGKIFCKDCGAIKE